MPANAEPAAALAQRYGLRVEFLDVLNEAGDFARKMSPAIAAFEKEARVVGAEHLDSVTAETLSIAVRRGTEFGMKINKILVATDSSEDAGAALDAAVEEMILPPRILGGLAGLGCAW